ncbi:uncharacterized protein N7529_010542 [Penicillium soppii]|uniref:uncharacterized protein n=1 Tax=Penicillium soppii TaxID=69789 RepID=UPI002548B276|nr:uncharacterized protein N7529_010542 [Penicillium soppii]KAJ5856598.1 hypothetical protein N7529_010542 [Penicillium soppii]
MAPVAIRQSHSLGPGLPRFPKRPPNVPVKVNKSIDPEVFGQLFAGTIGIFLLAVLFWKLGNFIRRFNRNKVLRAGKSTDTRYARTWYGWVSQTTHERNKKFLHDIFRRIWDSMAWKSTRADYSWVWWDPGDIQRQKRQREKRGLWWLPECLKSYDDFPTADELWNPCAQPQCHGALRESLSTSQAVPLPDTVQRPQAQKNVLGSILRDRSFVNSPKPVITRSILEELYRDPMQASDNSSNHHPNFHSFNITRRDIPASVTHQNMQSLPSRQRESFHVRASIPWSLDGVSQDISCQIESVMDHMEFQYGTMKSKGAPHMRIYQSHRHTCPRRYRRWSARMQLEPRAAVLKNEGGSSGPPGTPKTEILASYVSDRSSSFHGRLKQKSNSKRGQLQISEDQISFASKVSIGNQILFENAGRTYTRTIQWNSAPARSHSQGNGLISPSRPTLYDEWRSICDKKHPSLPRRKGKNAKSNALQISPDQIQPTQCAADDLSDWEVRMLERLDRKLVWIFNEFTPGQKPYHFAMLANHWMNKETWIVYDPISRVPIDARREWGDPRFNAPYPKPILSPRPKYPVSKRKRAHIPRIDSWRAAVNKQRKVSGIREAIRTITLYEESAEEPPDGHIDPACWSLPKPPQGFEMSTTQRNAWYEGGAGWQEKLHDWQQVHHHGYRIHKAIHEGRVNREKVKGVAAQINKSCRTISGKLIPNFDVGKIRASTPIVS